MDEGRGEWYLRRDSYTGKATISEAWRQRRLQNRGDGSGGGLPSQGHRLMHQASYTRTCLSPHARKHVPAPRTFRSGEFPFESNGSHFPTLYGRPL